ALGLYSVRSQKKKGNIIYILWKEIHDLVELGRGTLVIIRCWEGVACLLDPSVRLKATHGKKALYITMQDSLPYFVTCKGYETADSSGPTQDYRAASSSSSSSSYHFFRPVVIIHQTRCKLVNMILITV
ncbi:unnamed protein product, partial [Brassica oleracea]